MKLTKATLKDLNQFIKLEKEFRKYNESLKIDKQYKPISSSKLKINDYKKDFSERLNKKNTFFYFAEENKEYIGYIYGYIIKLPSLFRIKKIGYLDGIIVDKKYRHKKIASKLKKEFFNWLKKQKISICQINVDSKNKNALKVYQKWGFKVDEYRLFKRLKC